MPKTHDELSMLLADDLITIDHYRVALRDPYRDIKRMRYITVGEIDPNCDDVLTDDIAKYGDPEEAEEGRDAFARVNELLGVPTDAVVVGVSEVGVVLAIDGQFVTTPNQEDGSDIPI